MRKHETENLPDHVEFERSRLNHGHDLQRVQSLLDLYDHIGPKRRGRRPIGSSDLLRAAVVFMHAVLENHLRSLGRIRMPKGDSAKLDQVPLLDLSPHTRPEKFYLGALAAHRSKTVDDLIQQSVERHLERRSFNSIADVRDMLQSCGLESGRLEEHFDDIRALMERRHQIVHQADANPNIGKGQQPARSIAKSQVAKWLNTVDAFTKSLAAELELAEAPDA